MERKKFWYKKNNFKKRKDNGQYNNYRKNNVRRNDNGNNFVINKLINQISKLKGRMYQMNLLFWI